MPDYNAWYQHFKDARDGYVQPDHTGRYVVGSGKKYRKLKEIETGEKHFEFFDSLGHMAKDYGVGFKKIIKRKYLKNVGQLQQSTSNVCGLYCAYYVMKRHVGKTMKDIVKDFNVQQKKRNDRLIVTKMMKLCTRKRPVQRK